MEILAFRNGWELRKNGSFYYFGTMHDMKSRSGVPVGQGGTKEEVKAELERWKTEIDFNNFFMLEIENCFLNALA